MNAPTNPAETILVVDDSLDSIRMINDILENAGMTALVALEGEQALAITRNITPDLILLDAVMPRMDGFETCRRLKQNPQLDDVPIVFMTGLSDTEHVVMGFSVGGVDYVNKPIQSDELIARMKVHIANARVAQTARRALDHAGQHLFAVDKQGRILWTTPGTRRRMSESALALTDQDNCPVLAAWFAQDPQPGESLQLDAARRAASAEYLARIGEHEHLLRLDISQDPVDATERLRETFGLTRREADVTLWIAKGKTNWEIGQIVNISPRTVNKHLEQVFRKLGVENRTSAAAAAIGCLARFRN